MPKTLSDLEIERIKAKFKECLERDLTPEECRYLGLSHTLLPEEETKIESVRNRRKS
jgi:hypothetical protein